MIGSLNMRADSNKTTIQHLTTTTEFVILNDWMPDSVERVIMILWSVTVVVTSLLGDIIILLATFKHRAIKMHRVIVAVMQHMAICDLSQTIFRVLPLIPALIIDRWTLGPVLCDVQAGIGYLCNVITMFLTCALATTKLLLIKYPLKTRALTSRHGHILSFIVWILGLTAYLPLFVSKKLNSQRITFVSISYNCDFFQLKNAESYLSCYLSILGLPFLAVIATSVHLLVFAKKVAARQAEKMRWEGITTVLLTVGALIISFLPWGVVSVINVTGVHQPSPMTWRAVTYLQYLNIMANFFVYFLMVQSFRRFLKSKITRLTSSLRRSAWNTGRDIELRPHLTVSRPLDEVTQEVQVITTPL
jgi:hypothetical protein